MKCGAAATPLLAWLFQIVPERCGSHHADDFAHKVRARAGQNADRDAFPIFEAHDRTAPSRPLSFCRMIETLRSCSATQRTSAEFGARK
jgi:hypothetical protein